MRTMDAEAVVKVLYAFLQSTFSGKLSEIRPARLTRGVEPWIMDRLAEGDLHADEVMRWPLPLQKLLYELLTQYVMFLTMNPKLRFPAGFLEDSNDLQLGVALLEYIRRHSWPFPQLLPH